MMESKKIEIDLGEGWVMRLSEQSWLNMSANDRVRMRYWASTAVMQIADSARPPSGHADGVVRRPARNPGPLRRVRRLEELEDGSAE